MVPRFQGKIGFSSFLFTRGFPSSGLFRWSPGSRSRSVFPLFVHLGSPFFRFVWVVPRFQSKIGGWASGFFSGVAVVEVGVVS